MNIWFLTSLTLFAAMLSYPAHRAEVLPLRLSRRFYRIAATALLLTALWGWRLALGWEFAVPVWFGLLMLGGFVPVMLYPVRPRLLAGLYPLCFAASVTFMVAGGLA